MLVRLSDFIGMELVLVKELLESMEQQKLMVDQVH